MVITKRQAALLLVEGSVAAFEAENWVVAITLAGAAEEAMPRQTTVSLFEFLRDGIADCSFSKQNASNTLNFHRNWLKHYIEPDEVDIVMESALISLMRAIMRFQSVYGHDDYCSELQSRALNKIPMEPATGDYRFVP